MSNKTNTLPMSELQKRLRTMRADERVRVEQLLEGRRAGSSMDRRENMSDAIACVERALKCGGRCCAGKTRKERLEAA